MERHIKMFDALTTTKLVKLWTYLANALAKCLHSPRMGHALQFGLLFVQKTWQDKESMFSNLIWKLVGKRSGPN